MKRFTAPGVLFFGLLLGLAPVLQAEVTITVTQRKTATSIILQEDQKKANFWLTLSAPAGMHFETFEVTAEARNGKPDAPETIKRDLKLTQGEREVGGIAAINDYGARRDDTGLPRLHLFHHRGDAVSRDRARFVCLVRDEIPFVLQAGDQTLELPAATPGALALPKLDFSLKILEQAVVESVLTDFSHGPDPKDNMASEFFIQGKKLRRVTVGYTLNMAADPFRDLAVVVNNRHVALVDKSGSHHYPLGGISRTGIVPQISLDELGLMGLAGPEERESSDQKELVFIDDPALDEARLVFIPPTLD